MNINLKDKSVLITGGTGTLGQVIVKYLLFEHSNIKKIIVFSRDEQKQFLMNQKYSIDKYKQMRYFIGDIRDYKRLKRALDGVDYIIHTAAMKHVPIAEYNPMECIKTNVLGAENVINAALETGVKRVIALSTDKAAAPVNLYGATKLTSDKLFVAANNITGENSIIFSVVRYGNVMGSKGSVVPYFLNKKKEGVLPITDKKMTRFNITLNEGLRMVIFALSKAWGGEIFVPKISSFKIIDLANAIDPNCKKEIIGIRPGEKIHEEMITQSDSFNTYDLGRYYAILPPNPKWSLNSFIKKFKAKKVPLGFAYSSDNNDNWESIQSLKKIIKQEVDPNFKVK